MHMAAVRARSLPRSLTHAHLRAHARGKSVFETHTPKTHTRPKTEKKNSKRKKTNVCTQVGPSGELYAWGRADSGQLGIGHRWMAAPAQQLAGDLSGASGSGAATAGGGSAGKATGRGRSPIAPFVGPTHDPKGVAWPALVTALKPSEDPVVQVSCPRSPSRTTTRAFFGLSGKTYF